MSILNSLVWFIVGVGLGAIVCLLSLVAEWFWALFVAAIEAWIEK